VLKPVMLAPGRARLCTVPAPTGSITETNTTGIVRVASYRAVSVRERPQAVFVGPDPAFNNRRKQFVLQAMRHRLPAAYASREYAEAGGLLSYGTDFLDTYRQVGAYTGRVLRGAKPADLPVVQSTKFELVINQMTARILGLDVPPNLLAHADEVIE
jgi:putative ABC transport system substrate-binding protein